MLNQNTSDSTKELLSEDLIDYLFGLAEKSSDLSIHIFRLTSYNKGECLYQNIEHSGCFSNESKRFHLDTYSYPMISPKPINAVVGVSIDGVNLHMALVDVEATNSELNISRFQRIMNSN